MGTWWKRSAVLLIGIGTASGAEADVPCDKNHYILGYPCAVDTPPPPPATEVALDQPIGKVAAVANDSRGNVYLSSPHVVFRLDPNGGLTRIAGGPAPGFSGDGGPAFAARLDIPYDDYPEAIKYLDGPLFPGLAVDAGDTLYIADAHNDRVRKVDAAGIITSIVGPGDAPSGPHAPARIWYPQGIAFDRGGNLYISNGWLFKRTADGSLTTLDFGEVGAGIVGYIAPGPIALDVSGDVYASYGCRVRRLGIDGTVHMVAGVGPPPNVSYDGSCGYSGDGGPAATAQISSSGGVAVDGAGNLYFADTTNNCIRKVDPAGLIWTVAGACHYPIPAWLEVCLTRTFDGRCTGRPTRSAGYSGDGGPATEARLNAPLGVAIDPAGNLYIADTGNLRVRKVDSSGIITTVAGNGQPLPAGVIK